MINVLKINCGLIPIRIFSIVSEQPDRWRRSTSIALSETILCYFSKIPKKGTMENMRISLQSFTDFISLKLL